MAEVEINDFKNESVGVNNLLTLKELCKMIADGILYIFSFFNYYYSKKVKFDILCELSAGQTIHM